MTTCSKKGCSNKGDHNVAKDVIYCAKHYRFFKMRGTARRAGKYIPTHQELESCLANISGMLCPTCGREMLWKTKTPGIIKNLISLQHWNDGRIGFLCLSCNVRHGHSKLGDDFFNVPDSKKFCPRCNQVKSKDDFYTVKCRFDQRDSCCKKCKIKETNFRVKTQKVTP